MLSLDHLMQELANATNAELQAAGEVYSLRLPTAGGRSQTVHASVLERDAQNDMILFYTPVGPAVDRMDWRSLLEVNVGTVYARVGLLDDQIVIAAGQVLDTAEIDQLATMLNEVGTLGDLLEGLLFGPGDQY
jgi:hypothetical protein